MARDDKPALIALALILAALLALATLEIGSRHIAGEQPSNSESSWVDGNENGNSPPGLSENGHIFGDSWAQWAMAFFTALATGISAYAVKLVNDTLRTSRDGTQAAMDAVAVTRDIGERQIRPYILHDSASVRLVRSDDGIPSHLEVTVVVRNRGVTPATINAISCKVYAPSEGAGWTSRGSSWQAAAMSIGPDQTETFKFKGIDAADDGTFTWFSIGILIWYVGESKSAYEGHFWLTYDGNELGQGYALPDFELFRPDHSRQN